MPFGITQCYLPPGRGDIPALTSISALQEITSGHHYLNQNLFNFTINLEVALLLKQFLID